MNANQLQDRHEALTNEDARLHRVYKRRANLNNGSDAAIYWDELLAELRTIETQMAAQGIDPR